MPKLDRRTFLKGTACSVAGAGLFSPSLAISDTPLPTNKTLIFISAHGGLDPLHAFPTYAEQNYLDIRNGYAFGEPDPDDVQAPLDLGRTVGLSGAKRMHLGLNPRMSALLPLFANGEARLDFDTHHLRPCDTHAGNLSHFLQQNLMQSGRDTDIIEKKGWMNKLLAEMVTSGAVPGMAVTTDLNKPVALRGDVPTGNFSPPVELDQTELILDVLKDAYGDNPLMESELLNGIDTLHAINDLEDIEHGRGIDFGLALEDFTTQCQIAGLLPSMPMDLRPSAIFLTMRGFDVHRSAYVNGKPADGSLSTRLGEFANGIAALVDILKATDRYKDTIIVVQSEMGRRVAINGSNGTDHGFGGMRLVISGSSRVPELGSLRYDGPGLDQLDGSGNLPATLYARDQMFNDLLSFYDGELSVAQIERAFNITGGCDGGGTASS